MLEVWRGHAAASDEWGEEAMKVSEIVANASDPRAAMIALGTALDEVLELLRERNTAAPGWGSWAPADDWQPTHQEVHAAWETKPSGHRRTNAEIQLLEEQLAEEGDPDNRRALEAQLRLAKDDGGTIDRVGEVDAPSSFKATIGESNIVIDLPVVSQERQDNRVRFAAEHQLFSYIPPSAGLSEDEFLIAFSRGGPLWIWLDNRDAVMQMPPSVRRAFVEDVEQDSPRDAREMSMDILKDGDAGSPDITIAAIDAYSERH